MFPWDHNAYYHRLLLRQLPEGCDRVLDVGCGSGMFAAKAAEHVTRVDALDRNLRMIDRARRRVPDNVTCTVADVVETRPSPDTYDAVVSISALHHMDLTDTLPVLSNALRPGGVLAVIALPKTDLWREWPIELAATATHHALGGFCLVRQSLGFRNPYAADPADDVMPVNLSPTLTTREVAEATAAVLPGAQVRRLLLWRYLLTWRKPG